MSKEAWLVYDSGDGDWLRKKSDNLPIELSRNDAEAICDCNATCHMHPAPEWWKSVVESRDELLAACEAFVELFNDSDMRPEDECHELYATVQAAIAKARGEQVTT